MGRYALFSIRYSIPCELADDTTASSITVSFNVAAKSLREAITESESVIRKLFESTSGIILLEAKQG